MDDMFLRHGAAVLFFTLAGLLTAAAAAVWPLTDTPGLRLQVCAAVGCAVAVAVWLGVLGVRGREQGRHRAVIAGAHVLQCRAVRAPQHEQVYVFWLDDKLRIPAYLPRLNCREGDQ